MREILSHSGQFSQSFFTLIRMTDGVGREKMSINSFAQQDDGKKECVEHTNEIQIDEIYVSRW